VSLWPWWPFKRKTPPIEPGSARPEAKPTPAAEPIAPEAIRVRREAVARARIPPAGNDNRKPVDPFAPYAPPPGVLPPRASREDGTRESGPTLAMDDAGMMEGLDWARSGIMGFGGASSQGQAFVGFPTLALLAQRAEYRIVSEVIATEMVRKWIKFIALDGSDKAEKIKNIEAEFKRLKVRETFQEIALHDGLFGRAHLFLDFGDPDDDAELKTDIGDGAKDNAASKLKIKKGSLQSVRAIEAVWTYPQNYNSINPLRADWYKPVGWYVLGKQIHASRLLTFIGREVSDLLKPSYAFGGLSMSQILIPYVDHWLDIRDGVADIVKAFSVFVLSTNATDILAGGTGESFMNRLDIFNATRDNRGVLGIDKEREDFKNVSAPLGTLDALKAQSLENICCPAQLPLVKFTGISPSGLQATSEGELQVFSEHINARQEHFFRPNLTTVLNIAQLSLFGEVDPAIGFEFGELVEMTLEEEAALRKTNAETGEILVRAKAISSAEERARAIQDQDGPYTGLDPAKEVEFPMTENEKADIASKVATTASTLVAEDIIQKSLALREIRDAADISGFGLGITDEMISEAEEDEANAPDPGELAAMTAGGGAAGGDPADPQADPALAKAGEPGKPAPTVPGAKPQKSIRPTRTAATMGLKPDA